MDNQLHLTFGECLIMLWGLIVFYWMSRAPKSLLQLLGLGTETDHTWLVSLVRRSGQFFFFCLLNAMLLGLIPSSMTRIPRLFPHRARRSNRNYRLYSEKTPQRLTPPLGKIDNDFRFGNRVVYPHTLPLIYAFHRFNVHVRSQIFEFAALTRKILSAWHLRLSRAVLLQTIRMA